MKTLRIRHSVHVPGLFQKRGWWYFQPAMRDGVRPSPVSLRTKDRDDAVRQVLDIRRRDVVRRNPGRMSYQTTRFLSKAKFTKATVVTTRTALDLVSRRWGDPLVNRITTKMVAEWRDSMEAGGLSPATVSGYMWKVHGFLRWLVDDGQIVCNPMDKCKPPHSRKARVDRYCTKDQRDQLIAAAPNRKIEFVLRLAFFAGMRMNEIAEMRGDWVRVNGGECEIVVAKTKTFMPKDKTARSIPVSPSLMEFLGSWQPMGEDGYMLPGRGTMLLRYDPKAQIRRLAEKCGMPWFSVHVARRSFATHHLLSGTPVPVVAEWLGDSVRVTMDHYFAVCQGREHRGNVD